jgi:hypothetical protein
MIIIRKSFVLTDLLKKATQQLDIVYWEVREFFKIKVSCALHEMLISYQPAAALTFYQRPLRDGVSPPRLLFFL